jgi:REP element-mobilizing transposase RayT
MTLPQLKKSGILKKMSTSPKQQSLKDSLPLGSKERAQMDGQLNPRTRHGGEASLGRRKTPRPFASKAPVHLVLKSKRAKGLWSLVHRKNKARISSMIYTYAERFKVQVYRAAVEGNHIQLLVKANDRKNLADFLRVLAGRVAVVVSGAKRGIKKIGKFWDCLCWSRLVNWGKDFYQVRLAVSENQSSTEASSPASLEETWDAPFLAEGLP